MLGHIGVNVRDLVQAKAYYDGLMPLLGFEPYIAAADQFAYRPISSEPARDIRRSQEIVAQRGTSRKNPY